MSSFYEEIFPILSKRYRFSDPWAFENFHEYCRYYLEVDDSLTDWMWE